MDIRTIVEKYHNGNYNNDIQIRNNGSGSNE